MKLEGRGDGVFSNFVPKGMGFEIDTGRTKPLNA